MKKIKVKSRKYWKDFEKMLDERHFVMSVQEFLDSRAPLVLEECKWEYIKGKRGKKDKYAYYIVKEEE